MHIKMAELLTPLERDSIIKQSEVLENQSKILDRQTFFTELMALTSVIIGLTAFIDLFDLRLKIPSQFIQKVFQYLSNILLLTTISILIIIIFIYLLKKTSINDFIKKARLLKD